MAEKKVEKKEKAPAEKPVPEKKEAKPVKKEIKKPVKKEEPKIAEKKPVKPEPRKPPAKFEKKAPVETKPVKVEKREEPKPKVKTDKPKIQVEGLKIFGKYEPVVNVRDQGLKRYLSVSPRVVFHTHGRHAKKQFRKARVSIVERLINSLMRSGSSGKFKGKVYRDKFACGKKFNTYKMVREAFDKINNKTKKNPLEILVRAIENSAPREETTRVKYGGITYHVAVDVSPQRRVDFALHNISLATVIGSYNNPKTASQCLADELLNAANNDPKSLAIARKDEIELIARSAR
jgi:small subunit ribosomal protein S7